MCGLIAILAATPACAHDIPTSATLQGWIRADGQTVELVVRVPLRALRDVEYPQRGPGLLDLARADSAIEEGLLRWLPQSFVLRVAGQAQAPASLKGWRASLESERVYQSWAQARAHVGSAPLPDTVQVPWDQVMVDALLSWPVAAPATALALEPRIERFGLKVQMALQADLPGQPARAWSLHGNPGAVPLDAGWADVFSRFLQSGVQHVLGGADHLLFVICLVIPIRRIGPLVGVVTAFTIGHSITLAAAALGHAPSAAWFAPAIEAAIAASIVWIAIMNLLGQGQVRPRWILAALFGLIHGFGFALAMGDTLQFAGGQLLSALLAFNLGVEIGQVAVVALTVTLLNWALRLGIPERGLQIGLSALIAHSAWHWLSERADTLWRVLGA